MLEEDDPRGDSMRCYVKKKERKGKKRGKKDSGLIEPVGRFMPATFRFGSAVFWPIVSPGARANLITRTPIDARAANLTLTHALEVEKKIVLFYCSHRKLLRCVYIKYKVILHGRHGC